MSRMKIQRGAIRRSFNRAYNELKDETTKGADPASLSVLWRRLEDRYQQLIKLDEEIMQELRRQNATEEEIEEEVNTVQEYRDKWNDFNSEQDTVAPRDNRSVVSKGSNKGKTQCKLPKLKLVEFSGNPKEWLNFWSQFKSIHENESLATEDKFQYLIQATKEESAARRVVLSFPATGENYQKAIDHMKTRFGKDSILVEVYVLDLLKLVLTKTNGKQKTPLTTLYDKLETQLRALESLGVTTDKYAAMLYPLVESALSEDILIVWERIRNQRKVAANDDEEPLTVLMEFLRGEVESSIRLQMAIHSMNSDDEVYSPPKKQPRIIFEPMTTTDLFNKEKPKECIFCGKLHHSQDCVNVQKLTLKERFLRIREAGRCFRCLKANHFAYSCKASVKCQICNNKHYKLLCNKNNQNTFREINAQQTYHVFGEIIYQTLIIILKGPTLRQGIRALIDSGSGYSYITTQAVKRFGFKPIGSIEIVHSLFGGRITSLKKHAVYKVDVSNINNSIQEQYQLLEVERICNSINPTPNGHWIEELKVEGIQLSDCMQDQYQIHVLFGADIASKLYSGKIFETKSGPVAFETKFGWSLMGATTICFWFSHYI